MMQAAEAAVAQIHAEERSHCRQLLAEAKSGTAIQRGVTFCPATICPPWGDADKQTDAVECRWTVRLPYAHSLCLLHRCTRTCKPHAVWGQPW